MTKPRFMVEMLERLVEFMTRRRQRVVPTLDVWKDNQIVHATCWHCRPYPNAEAFHEDCLGHVGRWCPDELIFACEVVRGGVNLAERKLSMGVLCAPTSRETDLMLKWESRFTRDSLIYLQPLEWSDHSVTFGEPLELTVNSQTVKGALAGFYRQLRERVASN